MNLYNDVNLQSVATQFIGKPDYVITDGWNTDYIVVDYRNKTWSRVSDYFVLSDENKKAIDQTIFNK